MSVANFLCNPFGEFCYVVADEVSRDCAIIDPGMCSESEWIRVRDYIEQHQYRVRHILLTHGHVDHLMGTAYCTEAYGVEVSGSIEEQSHLLLPNLQAQMFGVPLYTQPILATHDVHDGDVLPLGEQQILVLDCPGHSWHGLCYYLPAEGVVFTGDTLFCGSVGRSDFGAQMGCNGRQLAEAIVNKLLVLPPDTKVYPGHGPSSTIDYESKYNPYF